MNRIYISFMQRLARPVLLRQPEMDIVMIDHSQNAEYTRDGQEGSLAILYDLIVNAVLRIAPSEGRALDICCGSASLLSFLASAMPGMQFLGVDLSPKMLEFARENKNKYGLTNLNFKAADMYKLPESVDGPFDLITWHLAMHHCMTQDDVVCVLKNIPRLLKPGGTFFVFDINRPKNGHLALTMADTFNRTEGDWFYQDSLDSYKAAFSFDEVKNIIKSSGLQHVRHIEPIMCNMFQAFYISQTDNKNAVKVSNLKHFWQKMDHALLKANFYALPQAVVRIKDKVREPSVSIGPPAGSILKEFNQDLIDVLQVGTQAMSAYNVQPWRFRVDGDQVFIHILRHKNFFLKLQGVYPMMAGHLLANMMEGARSKGYQVEYEIISEALNVDEPCIRMKLKKGFGRADITHVLERCTNRSFYSSQKIDKDIQREIIALGDDPNVRIDFVEDQAKENLAQILSHLECVRMSNWWLAREGSEVVHYKYEDVKRRGGLQAKALGFGYGFTLMLSLVKNSQIFFILAKLTGAVGKVQAHQGQLIRHSGAMVIFKIRNLGFKDFVSLGIIVQNIANDLMKRGIASMPMLGGVYLFDVLNENPEILSNGEKTTIIRARNELVKGFMALEERLPYILRVGYGEKVLYPTPRRNIMELIYGPGQKINPL